MIPDLRVCDASGIVHWKKLQWFDNTYQQEAWIAYTWRGAWYVGRDEEIFEELDPTILQTGQGLVGLS